MSTERTDTIAALCLIYCLDRLPDGSYVALNRHYKPIGHTGREWVKYEDLPVRFQFKRALTDDQIRAISCDADPSAERIYLYRGPLPTDATDWPAYSKRLRLLASLSVVV